MNARTPFSDRLAAFRADSARIRAERDAQDTATREGMVRFAQLSVELAFAEAWVTTCEREQPMQVAA